MLDQEAAAGSGDDAGAVPPRQFLRFICAGLAQVESISIARYEEAELEGCKPLLAKVGCALDVAMETMGLVLAYYESQGARAAVVASGKLGQEMDRRMAAIRCAGDVADLAFVGRLALRASREALGAVAASQDKWEIISVAGSACREMRKSLGALELAVCTLESLPYTGNDYVSELAISREVRRTYVAFCQDILGSGEPSADDLVKRVRVAATSIVKLTGRAIYPAMRVDDRILLRTLNARLMDWLRAVARGSTGGSQAGQRLWRDIAGAAEILLSVNNRAELREHDLHTLGVVLDWAQANPGHRGPFPQQQVELLQSLAGRDRELDAQLAQCPPPDAATLLPMLQALHARLVGSAGSPAAAGGSGDVLLGDGDVF